MSQVEKLFNLLKDRQPHRTDEILKKVYGNNKLGIARISARVYDVKNKYLVKIESWEDTKKRTLWWYQMVTKPKTVFKK